MKNGILVVNKPEGITSAGVVGRLKRVLGVKKIGHTGTLDPFATGVLLIAIQKATRISQYFLDGSKRYLAQVTLGQETDTYDKTGKVTFQADPKVLTSIEARVVQKAVAQFSGVQDQVAPSYSALKHQGQPLYKLARQGKMILKPPRQIEIFDIAVPTFDLQEGQLPAGLPRFDLDVHCSGGTYIRSLAYDIGKMLGCGAHLSGLCRTRSSQFLIEDASDLSDLQTMDRADIEDRIVSMSQCLSFLPFVTADAALGRKVSYGQKLTVREVDDLSNGGFEDHQGRIRVVDQSDELLAIIEPANDQTYNYCCVFMG